MTRMSLHLETQEAFQSLGVEDLPEEWVSLAWEQNFCESISLPIQVEDRVLSTDNWEKVVQLCRRWVEAEQRKQQHSMVEEEEEEEEQGSSGVGFWTALLDAEVSHKSLVTLLYCLTERPKQSLTDRLSAVYAAQLYLVLLQMPGSGAFKIFHPMIFQKAMDMFYLFPDKEVLQGRKVATKRAARVGGGRRGKRKRRQVEEEEEEKEEDESIMMEESVVGEGGEEVKKLLRQLIKDLHNLLLCHSLADHEVARYQVIQVMVRMARTELVGTSGMSLHLGSTADAPDDAPLCVLAWQCLESLIQPLHGPLERNTSEVFQQILPILLMLMADGSVCTSSSFPSPLTISSQHALDFSCFVSEKYGESVVTPLKVLVQHLCTKVPDRAEYRNRLAPVVMKLLSLFSDELYSRLLDWIYKFSRNTKVVYRVFALDIVAELLNQPLRCPKEGSLSGEDEYRLNYKFLLRMVLSRCSDKAPSVRSRALSCLAAAASSSNPEVVEATKRSVFSITTTDPLIGTPHAGAAPESVIVLMLRRRATDEKVGVRKTALLALEGIIRLNITNISRDDVFVIYERCLDPALSVRKQALSSLTALTLDLPHCTILHSLWLEGVLPMVMDREVGAQEKCMSLLEEVILGNITTLNKSTNEMHTFVWQLLQVVASEERLDLRRHLKRAVEFWSRQGKLTPALVKAVCSHTESKDHLQAAWMLLAELSQFSSSIELKFLLDSWKQHHPSVTMATHTPFVQILVVIGNMARKLSKIAMQDVRDEIISLLSSFKLSPVLIQAAVNTLCQICSVVNPPKDYQASLDSWCVPLLKSCEQYLSSVMLETSDSGAASPVEFNETEAVCYLFTLGEVAQLSPAHTSHHLCLMVQSLLLATSDGGGDVDGSRSTSHTSQLSGLKQLSLSPMLRAHGYITLGKLCLQNEELTKKSILQMAKELEQSPHAAIRNNIIVVLCDLAVRYSTKVDPYIPNISACLRDESLLVRKQTLTLLAHLLQEDYVKWKGSLFFRFVSTLVDEGLKRFSEFCLVHLLLARHPGTFYQHFVECVFHFNSYEKHKVYNRFKQSDRERKLFSLKGQKNANKRMTIYTFLLSHMADEHRFQLTAKLCQEVLGGVVDGAIPLDDDSASVVRDTLGILTSKEIKLSSLRRNVGEELAEEGDQVGAAVATAQTKIISQIVKRNVMENIIPIVVSAKHLFERERSPLLRDLLLYIKELMQDYRNEITNIMAADKQLAEEIEFDLKRFEEEQKRIAKPQTPLSATPHAQMISPLLSPGVLGTPAAAAATSSAVKGGSVFTPPRLRKTPAEGGGEASQCKKIPTPVLKTKTPLRVSLGMSPLVMVQRVHAPLSTHRPPPKSHLAVVTQKVPDEQAAQGSKEDVNSPAAARTRANMVNSEYVTRITTPVRPTKTPHIPLQRAVLLSTARRTARGPLTSQGEEAVVTPFRGGRREGEFPSDETILPTALHERAASTPEGLVESISFNVSSLVPPSPIPANTTVESYSRRTRSQTRKKKQEKETGPAVDILMLPPEAEPRKLDKWKVTVK